MCCVINYFIYLISVIFTSSIGCSEFSASVIFTSSKGCSEFSASVIFTSSKGCSEFSASVPLLACSETFALSGVESLEKLQVSRHVWNRKFKISILINSLSQQTQRMEEQNNDLILAQRLTISLNFANKTINCLTGKESVAKFLVSERAI